MNRTIHSAACSLALLFATSLFATSMGCGKSPAPTEAVTTTESAPESRTEGTAEPHKNDASASQTQPSSAAANDSPESFAPQAIKREPIDPDQLRGEALAALEAGDLDVALERIRKAQSADPDHPDSQFVMAQVLAGRNRFAEAIKILDDMSEKTPDARLPILGQTADWLVEHGRWREAEKRYRELLDEVPDAAMAQRALARLLLRQGRRLEAAGHLRELCRAGVVEPSNLRTLLCLTYPLSANGEEDDGMETIGAVGRARQQLGNDQWHAALDGLKTASASSPQKTALIGRIHAHLEQYDALQQWAAEHPEPSSDSSDHWFALAVHQAHSGDDRSAVRSLCNAVRVDPTDDRAYALLAESLARLMRDREAKLAKQRAEQIAQTHALGRGLNVTADTDVDDVLSLADQLVRLRRPFEALGWRIVAVTIRQARGELSEQQTMQAIGEINQQRLQQLNAADAEPSESFLLCDVDPETLSD